MPYPQQSFEIKAFPRCRVVLRHSGLGGGITLQTSPYGYPFGEIQILRLAKLQDWLCCWRGLCCSFSQRVLTFNPVTGYLQVRSNLPAIQLRIWLLANHVLWMHEGYIFFSHSVALCKSIMSNLRPCFCGGYMVILITCPKCMDINYTFGMHVQLILSICNE